jgi:hypothetical protein
MDDDVKGFQAHSAYFSQAETLKLMRDVLCGLDREVVLNRVPR